MPPALRPLCFACLTLWMAVPVCTASPVVLSATMAPIADDEPTSAPRSPAPENLVPDAPLLDPAKPDTTGFINPKAATSNDDLMCAHAPAGTVADVPAPFKFWMVLVCAPQAQALVPVEGMVWFAHGTRDPVSVLALPPGVADIPHTADYNPSYNVRFKSIFASEVKGVKRDRALGLLVAAQTKDNAFLAAGNVERIYQLDAVSSVYDMRYNIYFYVSDKLPRAGLICIDACRQMLLVDILNNDEAQVRLQKP